MDQAQFSLLSRLWLKEAGQETLAEMDTLPSLGQHAAGEKELAIAYTEAFLLNVYPYASVFLDLDGEMNGLRSRELAALYQQFGYQPAFLYEAGAPDHLGLVLGLLAHIPHSQRASVLSKFVLDWAPVLCLSIERQPSVHPFYRALAACTRQALFQACTAEDLTSQPPPFSPPALADAGHPQDGGHPEDGWIELPLAGPDEELSLSQVIHYLLCPSRSGMFLSRSQLGKWAQRIGVPLAFGERYRLGISLFEAAGLAERVPELLDWLLVEVEAWDAAYAGWTEQYPVWTLFAGEWRERLAATRNLLEKARLSVQDTVQ